LGRLTLLTPEELRQQLQQLQSFGILEYMPQKETPQIYFVQNRAPADHLTFNHEDHLKRKHEYALRVKAMEEYISLKDNCRSKFIGNYFGDVDMKKCGSCDNCLHQKIQVLSNEEFNKISSKIFIAINNTEKDIKDLLTHLPNLNKEKVWKVINFLQAEGKLVIKENGCITAA
ncbi:MAG: RecQ family ATP-dependent helicase, partial [Segetibacter sp.]|nr:RecQ family ATP-dependent helicase [Segetibacter sp.]